MAPNVLRERARGDAGVKPGVVVHVPPRVRGWGELIREWIGEGCNLTVQGFWSVPGWLFSIRLVGVFFFMCALICAGSHQAEWLYLDAPPILFYPFLAFCVVFAVGGVLWSFGQKIDWFKPTASVAVIVALCGSYAGLIIKGQLMKAHPMNITENDLMYMGIACAVLSYCVYIVDYGWALSMKGVLTRAILVGTLAWSAVLYFFPLPSLPTQLSLFVSFTLPVGVLEYYVTENRAWLPFIGGLPAAYIGCMVHSLGMLVLSTYMTSLLLSLDSHPLYSPAWLVFAGPPLCFFTLFCHLFYWIGEKMYGPGPHNKKFVIGVKICACTAAFVVFQFGIYEAIPKWKFW